MMEPDMSQPLLPVIIPDWNTWIQGLNPSEATVENQNVSGIVGTKAVCAEPDEDEQLAEPNLELLSLDDEPRYAQTAVPTRGCNSMQATHLNQCLERLAILEAEIFQLRTKENQLEHDVGLANTKIEQQFRGELMELLEEELSCGICSDILIEVSNLKMCTSSKNVYKGTDIHFSCFFSLQSYSVDTSFASTASQSGLSSGEFSRTTNPLAQPVVLRWDL